MSRRGYPVLSSYTCDSGRPRGARSRRGSHMAAEFVSRGGVPRGAVSSLVGHGARDEMPLALEGAPCSADVDVHVH
eukprot:1365912-Prymnesium_polylepis.2